jgi:biopolymer transport protein ExbB
MLAGAALLAACSSDAQTHTHPVQTAVIQLEDRIDRATRELNAVRDAIAEERGPLVEELDTLRAEVTALRSEAQQRKTAQARDQAAHDASASELAALEDTYRFLEASLREYRRSVETRLSIADAQAASASLQAIDQHPSEPAALAETVAALTALAEQLNIDRLGGRRFDGDCVGPSGRVLAGSFAVLGPLSYFATSEGDAAGWAVARQGSPRPTLLPVAGSADASAIRALAAGEEALVPIDPLAGEGLQRTVATPPLRERLLAGGAVMIPLALVGLLAAALILVKTYSLRHLRLPGESILDDCADRLRAGDLEGAQTVVAALSPPFRALLRAGIEYREVRRDHLEEILQERALALVPGLERHLGLLAVLGGVAPLLGLLGTVTGMIHTFELVTVFGTGDASLLSGGISEALITTQVGLVIAVPVLLIHAVLSRKVSALVDALEQTLIGFLNRLDGGAPAAA